MKRNLLFITLLSATCLLKAQQPEFSHTHGFYDAPFSVCISIPADMDEPEGCNIRYTTDGSAPTVVSTLYNSPIVVSGNTLLRAVLERCDTLVGPATTATYLFIDDVLSAPDVPDGYPKQWGAYIQSSGTAKGDYGMDSEITEKTDFRPKVIEGLRSLPTLSIVTDKDNFFSHNKDSITGGIYIYTGPPVGDKTGRDWVRPISIELFGCDEDLTADCGVKIHGGHSRLSEKTPKHSLRLMFKEKYGTEKGKLKYRLFGEDGAKKFDQVILRCMFGNTWTHWTQEQRLRAQYERDMWMRSTQLRMGHPAARGRYVNLYINGMFWGIYCLTERVNDYYCSSNFGGEKSQYDVIKVDEEQGEKIVASEGTIDKWQEVMDMAAEASTSNAAYFSLIGCDNAGNPSDEVEQLLDIDNFIDYMLLNQYGGNDDWDKHNWLAFRNREDSTQGFRMLCWDSEIIFTTMDYNALDKDKSMCPSRILNNLVKNVNFLHRYMDRAYKHLESKGGLLTNSEVVATWDSLYQILEMPLWAESARWGDYRRDVHKQCNNLFRPDKEYMTERNRLLDNYFPGRGSKLLEQLKAKGWYSTLQVPRVKYNGVFDVVPDTLHIDDVLQLQRSATILYTVDGTPPVTWATSVSGKPTESAITYQTGENLIDAIDWTSDKVTIRAISRKSTTYSPTAEWNFVLDHTGAAIRDIHEDSATETSVYDLQGRRIDPDKNGTGMFIIRSGNEGRSRIVKQ